MRKKASMSVKGLSSMKPKQPTSCSQTYFGFYAVSLDQFNPFLHRTSDKMVMYSTNQYSLRIRRVFRFYAVCYSSVYLTWNLSM